VIYDMKRTIAILILIIVIFSFSACEKQDSVIAVMDMDKVLKQSKYAVSLQNNLTELGQGLEEKYNQKKEELSGEKKQEELDKIYQQFLQSKQSYEGKLNEEIKIELEKLAKEMNFDIVLYKKEVHYGGKDITDDLIKRLDEKYDEGEEK